MKASQKHTRYPKGKKTVGDIIDHIAESFSQEADVTGLFILEQALEQAKELKSFEQRSSESEAMYAKARETLDRIDANKVRIMFEGTNHETAILI